MKRKFLLNAILAISLTLSLAVPIASAEQSKRKEFAENSNGERIVAVYKPTENGLVEVSIEEYENAIAESEKLEAQKKLSKLLLQNMKFNSLLLKNSNTITPYALDAYKYTEAGFFPTVTRTSLTDRVSIYYANDSDSKLSYTIQYAASQTYTANRSITASGEKNAIKLGITVGSSWSNTYSSSTSATKDVTGRYYGWMEYTPVMGNSFGTMLHGYTSPTPPLQYLEETYFLDIYVAREMPGGMPDGYYVFKERPCSGGVCDPY